MILVTKALVVLQAGTRAHDKSRIRVRDLGQLGVFVLFDGAHEFQFQGVQQAEVVGGVVSLVEDQGRFGDDRRSTGQLAEELVKSLQHQRKLPGVVAVSFVDVVEQRQLTIGGAEQGVTHLPEVVASLFVLASDGQATAGVQRIEEGVEVRTVVADRGQVDAVRARRRP